MELFSTCRVAGARNADVLKEMIAEMPVYDVVGRTDLVERFVRVLDDAALASAEACKWDVQAVAAASARAEAFRVAWYTDPTMSVDTVSDQSYWKNIIWTDMNIKDFIEAKPSCAPELSGNPRTESIFIRYVSLGWNFQVAFRRQAGCVLDCEKLDVLFKELEEFELRRLHKSRSLNHPGCISLLGMIADRNTRKRKREELEESRFDKSRSLLQ